MHRQLHDQIQQVRAKLVRFQVEMQSMDLHRVAHAFHTMWCPASGGTLHRVYSELLTKLNGGHLLASAAPPPDQAQRETYLDQLSHFHTFMAGMGNLLRGTPQCPVCHVCMHSGSHWSCADCGKCAHVCPHSAVELPKAIAAQNTKDAVQGLLLSSDDESGDDCD